MTDTPSQIPAAAQNADDLASETLQNLQARHWHLASVGLGNCRIAQALQLEIERRQNDSDTGVSPISSLNRPGADARATIEQLTAGLAHLESVRLGNSRSAQIVRGELSRQLLIQSALLLANAGFDSNEPRDSHGQWTANAIGSATNRPTHANTTHMPDHPGTKNTTVKSKTSGTAGGTKPAPAATPLPEKIALSTNEPALMIERLLLAETKGVEESGFNKAEALRTCRQLERSFTIAPTPRN